MPRTIHRNSPAPEPEGDIERLFTEFQKLDKAAKAFASKRDEYKGDLMSILAERGVEDERGHFWTELADGRAIKREKRGGNEVLNWDAVEEFLYDRGWYEECLTPALDEDKVLAKLYEGKVPDAEKARLYITSPVTWAFVPGSSK